MDARRGYVLTAIPSQHYSGVMISEFDQLADKVRQLSDLAQSMRKENADLRRSVAALKAENEELSARMQQAQQRVAALLESIPVTEPGQEAA